jgi:hypothetical protein
LDDPDGQLSTLPALGVPVMPALVEGRAGGAGTEVVSGGGAAGLLGGAGGAETVRPEVAELELCVTSPE